MRTAKDRESSPIPSKACRFEGCGRPTSAYGLCQGHARQIKKGRELAPIAPRMSNKGKTCYGPECRLPAVAKGLCAAHQNQLHRYDELYPLGTRQRRTNRMYEGISCVFEECERPAVSNNLCGGHDAQWRRTGGVLTPFGVRPRKPVVACEVADCAESANRRGMCDLHYRQFLRTGKTWTRKRVMTKTGRRLNADGYVMIKMPGHSETTRTGWGLEHRIVMSDHLGRPLWPDENVHHKNGDRTDNRLENLELWSRKQPKGQRVLDKLAWAREIIERYGSDSQFTP